jgi:predicted transposase YdaD
MPQTRVEPWIEQWKQEGRLEGEERVEQRGRREGDQQGEKRGEQKGLRQGWAAFLLRLLERRFGVLPCWGCRRRVRKNVLF